MGAQQGSELDQHPATTTTTGAGKPSAAADVYDNESSTTASSSPVKPCTTNNSPAKTAASASSFSPGKALLDGLRKSVPCGKSDHVKDEDGITVISDYQNVIFDFDSTVIKTESLEVTLEDVMAGDPLRAEKMKQIEELTQKGMAGEISFKEGLEARLKIAAPRRKDLAEFAEKYCPSDFMPGMVELVKTLHAQGKKVFILSGGFVELIMPFARYLEIPENRVHAVLTSWDESGNFLGLDDSNGFATSKLEGAGRVAHLFSEGKTVMVGDGYTDYQLYAHGIADEFIAFTEFAAREKVMAVAPHIASDSTTLHKMLGMNTNQKQKMKK